MPERIGTVEHTDRLGAEARDDAPPLQQVADERFPAGNQLVREDVPRARLEPPLAQQRAELLGALRTHVEIVVEQDGLPVEQKTLAEAWRVIEELVNERDEPLPEALDGEIPLAIPMRVGDDVGVENRD